MRTFDKKDVLSAININEAEKYIDKNGYFGNNLTEIQKAVDNEAFDTLGAIEEGRLMGRYISIQLWLNRSSL